MHLQFMIKKVIMIGLAITLPLCRLLSMSFDVLREYDLPFKTQGYKVAPLKPMDALISGHFQVPAIGCLS